LSSGKFEGGKPRELTAKEKGGEPLLTVEELKEALKQSCFQYDLQSLVVYCHRGPASS